MTQNKRLLIYYKYGGHCAYCGCSIKKSFTIDHIRAKVNGGTDDMTNLFPACRVCNLLKGRLNIEHFRQRLLCGDATADIQYVPYLWIRHFDTLRYSMHRSGMEKIGMVISITKDIFQLQEENNANKDKRLWPV